MKKILSIDGGGIRGIIPAYIINFIEKKIQTITKNNNAKISDYFDLIVGTSSGGLLTMIYLYPDENMKPKYTAQDALDLFIKYGNNIFSSTWFYKIKNLFGLLGYKYDIKNLEKILKLYLNNEELKNLIKPAIITSYDLFNRQIIEFNSSLAKNNIDYNFYLKDVARATSAAPTYFKPVDMKSFSGMKYICIDGVICNNSPAFLALLEAKKIFSCEEKDILLLSLSNGADYHKYTNKELNNYNKISWINKLFYLLIDGNGQNVDYNLSKIFQAKNCSQNYLRIEQDMSISNINFHWDIDDTSYQNIHNLQKIAENLLQNNINNINLFINSLLKG